MTDFPHIPKQFRFLYSRPGFSAHDKAGQWLPFREIDLKRTPCLGKCPVYRVSLGCDGRAQYEGDRYVSKIGTYTGNVPIRDYGKLCYLASHIGVENLKKEYSRCSTDLPSVELTLVKPDESRVRVSDYGESGPIELWALQQAIEAVADRIHWTQQSSPMDSQDAATTEAERWSYPIPQPTAEAASVQVDEKGWTQCPNCAWRFKPEDAKAFENGVHRRCGQRIRIAER